MRERLSLTKRGLRAAPGFALLALLATLAALPAGAAEPLAFGVLNQRSPQLTAQYWNPILDWVGRRSGVPLQMKMGRTAVETTAMTVRGDFDFAYTNHLFTPERDKLGFRVIVKPATPGIEGEIVVLADSPIRRLGELRGKDVAFPSPEAFAGYWVPMDGLMKAGVRVNPRFAGNQEGAIGQLRAGAVAAAAVNGRVLRDFATRENLPYRTLWKSETYLDIPIMAHPRVPARTVAVVRQAFADMARDPEGQRILAASAAVIRQPPPYGFVEADDRDYDNYRRFYRGTRVTAP